MKTIVVSLILLGLCANICYADVTPTAQLSSIASLWLNGTATKVYSIENQTDAVFWNQAGLTPAPASPVGVEYDRVIFGPGTSNDTIYVYGLLHTSNLKIHKRTLNATIVGWGNDTSMACVIKDEVIILPIELSSNANSVSIMTAVAPGYLAILLHVTEEGNSQIYLILVSGNTATSYTLASFSLISTPLCKGHYYVLGNIWYDIGAAAFFYTYSDFDYESANCQTEPTTYFYKVYLGGHYVNGTAYWAAPGLPLTASVGALSEGILAAKIKGGGDNWLNSSNIYVVYKDMTASPPVTYYSKTAKDPNTTAGGAFSVLVSDDATTDATKTYIPLSVWASNFTYGIAVACYNQTDASTYNYPIWNFLNGTTTATDSGLSYTGLTNSDGGAASLSGWMLSTGYTLVGGWYTSDSDTYNYQMGTFYANGTANQTASTLATVMGPVSFFQDVKGAMWVGWTDVDTNNDWTYAGYLAKFQGQINVVVAGANTLSAVLTFIAFLLASIVAY